MSNREQFEAWFENDVVGAAVTFPAFEDGEYVEGELYDDQLYFMLQAMWMAWQAATKASEAQLTALTTQLESVVAELSAVLTDRAVILEDLDNTCFEIGMMLGEKSESYPVPVVVNHDAFLAEVRASGVEMFAEHISGMNISASETSVREFAAQLRQEASQ